MRRFAGTDYASRLNPQFAHCAHPVYCGHMDDEVFLKPRDVADMFGVHPATVLRWAHAGTLPSVSLPSGRLVFKRDDIAKVLAKGGA
jgi:Helix-turn-helix domain